MAYSLTSNWMTEANGTSVRLNAIQGSAAARLVPLPQAFHLAALGRVQR